MDEIVSYIGTIAEMILTIMSVRSFEATEQQRGVTSMPGQKPWNWCVAGNITKTHIDPDGTIRYGSSAYCGGTKVYLCGRNWNPESDTVLVCGLDRYHMYTEHVIPIALIENVRLSRVYKPSVISWMNV